MLGGTVRRVTDAAWQPYVWFTVLMVALALIAFAVVWALGRWNARRRHIGQDLD
jgi:hypothetical protein